MLFSIANFSGGSGASLDTANDLQPKEISAFYGILYCIVSYGFLWYAVVFCDMYLR